MKPYALIADVHLHNWSAFAEPTIGGINTRLAALLDEFERVSEELEDAGGDTIVIAGDLFHVRGSVKPSVLNPTLDTIRDLIKNSDMRVVILPGNHDLEGKQSTRLSSAITAMEGAGAQVVESAQVLRDERLVLVPWIEDLDELKKFLEVVITGQGARSKYDLIIHAPVDRVLPNLPGHGLDPEWLAGLGYKRVFAGHYHNHVEVAKNVYSIGALAHHTWSDVGTKAGFLIVHPDHVVYRASHLPSFVDVSAEDDEKDLALAVDGNYVRCKVKTDAKMSQLEELRKFLTDAGAKGVTLVPVREAVTARTGTIAAGVAAGASVEASITEFIKEKAIPDAAEVEMETLKCLAEAEVA